MDAQYRNTDSGKAGIFCAICHTMGATRTLPFITPPRAPERNTFRRRALDLRGELLDGQPEDNLRFLTLRNEIWGTVLARARIRLSPHAIGRPELFGPLAATFPGRNRHLYQLRCFGQEYSLSENRLRQTQGTLIRRCSSGQRCAASVMT